MKRQASSKVIRSLSKIVFASLPLQYKFASIFKKIFASDLDFYKKNWIQLYKDEAAKHGIEVSNKSATMTINNVIKKAMSMEKSMANVVDLIQEALIPILKYKWFETENLKEVTNEDDLSKLFQRAIFQKMIRVKEDLHRTKHRQQEDTVSLTTQREEYSPGQISEEELVIPKDYPALSNTESWEEFKYILMNELASHSKNWPLDKIFDLYYFHNLTLDEVAEKLFVDNDTKEIVAPNSVKFQLGKAEKITKQFIKTYQGQRFLDKLQLETGINL